MRKFLIPAALLASTIAAAAPAAAQWQQPNGYAYGYNNRGQARRLEVRVMQLRREIAQLDRRNILSNREARRLDAEARNLEYRVRQQAFNGLSQRERWNIERRIARLEMEIRREATDGNRYNDGRRDGSGWDRDRDDNRYDRDRDGRDDRYEDDRGRDRDD
jgi:hypothetical protein